MLEEIGETVAPQSASGEGDGVSVLPALAEVHRRAGRADEAEQVARRGLEFEPDRPEARAVLALALLDQGREAEARATLEVLTSELLVRHGLDVTSGTPAAAEPPADVSDEEIDQAFAGARPEADQMLHADDVAERAIREADRELVDRELADRELADRELADRELAERELAEPEPADPALAGPIGVPFATRTVAELLESQGDRDAASQVRAVIEATEQEVRAGDDGVVRELERWLENLRRRRS